MLLDVRLRHAEVDAFDFRRVHPSLRFGTASDRYAGWLGQVYPREAWEDRVSKRAKRLGGQTYEERTLPVESTADYFRHFSVVELDFTFYRPLLEEDGRPSNNLFVLQQYAEHAPESARFLLKAPQAYSARVRRVRGGYEANPTYLDAKGYRERFLAPARDVLGERLGGVLFEQEYARVRESPPPEALVSELDGFFADVPSDVQTHLEVRSPHLLTPPYFGWLADRGLGFVFSHWTWLPSIKGQWGLSGGRFTAANGEAVLRLLTPRKARYEDAYRMAYPFDRPVPELSETAGAREMIEEAVALAYKAVEAGAILNVIANNRAFGNAPALDQAIAFRFLEFAEPRGA